MADLPAPVPQKRARRAASGTVLRGGGPVRGDALLPAGKHRAHLHLRLQRGGDHLGRAVLHRDHGGLAAGRRTAAEAFLHRIRGGADGHHPDRPERQLRTQAQPHRGHPRHAGGGGLGLLLHPDEEDRRVPHQHGAVHPPGVLLRPAVHGPGAVPLRLPVGSGTFRLPDQHPEPPLSRLRGLRALLRHLEPGC